LDTISAALEVMVAEFAARVVEFEVMVVLLLATSAVLSRIFEALDAMAVVLVSRLFPLAVIED
jgi:hypothetical protein